MTAWQPESIRLEEPACGVHFAPYGAIELAYINALIADMALDCLLGNVSKSTHRAWLARRSVLDENGGRWTAEAVNAMSGEDTGGRTVDLNWAACDCCRSARVALNDKAAYELSEVPEVRLFQ
jgi:hypothetical protein